MVSEFEWKPPIIRERQQSAPFSPFGEITDIFRQMESNYNRSADSGFDWDEGRAPLACGVAVASHLPQDQRQLVYGELCTALGVQSAPVRLGLLLGRGIPTRGTFLDNVTRYQESIHRCSTDQRLAMIERRQPARGGRRGQLYAAYVVIAVESSAFPNGYPSQSLRGWLKNQGPAMKPRN
jgi:hypothetical protein